MYLYALCIPCCLFFTTGIFVFGRTLASAIPVFCNLTFAALFILTYFVSKKSDNFVYLVPISRLLITALYLYLTSGTILDSSQCEFYQIFMLICDEAYFALCLLTDTIFLSPSVRVTLLTHTPVFLLGHFVQIKIRYQQFDDPWTTGLKGTLIMAWFSMIFMIYYLLTLQNLERFQELQLTARKEQ